MTDNSLQWLSGNVRPLDQSVQQAALQRQAKLTKPPGALGLLEDLAVKLAAMQGRIKPEIERIHICVFAADHGVAEEGVSAFPQAVTGEMIKNFSHGGAAISVAARELGATLQVVNLGTVNDPGNINGVRQINIAGSTANIARAAAMTPAQLAIALNAGKTVIDELTDTQLFIGGEMGIANTTVASALACALLKLAASELAGPGTGLDKDGVNHKAVIIQQALNLHHDCNSPLEIMQKLGGFEIAALTGSFIACAQQGITILVDGFICSVAALFAIHINPGVRNWCLFSHRSAEPGHRHIVEALKAKPVLDLGMRLGEGSGAAVAVPIIKMACALHNSMATFEEAAVSGKVK